MSACEPVSARELANGSFFYFFVAPSLETYWPIIYCTLEDSSRLEYWIALIGK